MPSVGALAQRARTEGIRPHAIGSSGANAIRPYRKLFLPNRCTTLLGGDPKKRQS